MPRQYPQEFRFRAVALVRAGKPVKHVAQDLGISAGGLQQWVRQDRIDRGEIPGTSSTDHTELVRAKRRIRELEQELAQELEIDKRAAKLLGEDAPHPKESTRISTRLSRPGFLQKYAAGYSERHLRGTASIGRGRSLVRRCAGNG